MTSETQTAAVEFIRDPVVERVSDKGDITRRGDRENVSYFLRQLAENRESCDLPPTDEGLAEEIPSHYSLLHATMILPRAYFAFAVKTTPAPQGYDDNDGQSPWEGEVLAPSVRLANLGDSIVEAKAFLRRHGEITDKHRAVVVRSARELPTATLADMARHIETGAY